MKDMVVQFTNINTDDEFRQFAENIGGKIESGNVLQPPPKMARGSVKKFKIEAGLHMRVWNLLLLHPVEFCRQPATNGEANGFNVLYILTPGSCTLKSIDEHPQFGKISGKCALLSPSSIKTSFELQPGQPVQLLDFSISAERMKQFRDIALKMAGKDAVMPDLQAIEVETLTAGMGLTARQLFNTTLHNEDDMAAIHTLSGSLINGLLEKISTVHTNGLHGSRAMYFDKIMEAEAILLSHLQKNLPTVEDIAHRLALSESTLKRHFKVTFGKSIYVYYLEKKMDLAKQILEERPITVNEVAQIIGYEKVSNFIDIFKKHHGFSPGSMKKRREESHMAQAH